MKEDDNYIEKQLEIIKSFDDQKGFFLLKADKFSPEFILEKMCEMEVSNAERDYIDAPELKFQEFLKRFKKLTLCDENGIFVYRFNIDNVKGIEAAIASKIKRIFEKEIDKIKQTVISSERIHNIEINVGQLAAKIEEITGRKYEKVEYSNSNYILNISPFENLTEVKTVIKKFSNFSIKAGRTNPHLLQKDKIDSNIYEKAYIIQIKGKEEVLKILDYKQIDEKIFKKPELSKSYRLKFPQQRLKRSSPINASKVQAYFDREAAEYPDPNNNVDSPTKKQKSSGIQI